MQALGEALEGDTKIGQHPCPKSLKVSKGRGKQTDACNLGYRRC